MDLAAAIGLTATAAQLVNMCANCATGLRDVYKSQGRAAKALLPIESECLTLRAAVEGVEVWSKSSNAMATEKQAQLKSLDDALQTLTPSLKVLSEDVERMLRPVDQNADMDSAGRLRYMWGRDDIAIVLDELRWLSHQIHILTTVINLPVDEAESKLETVHDNASEHYLIDRGQSDFNRELMNTAPYRRAHLALPRPTLQQGNRDTLLNIPEASPSISE